MHTVGVFKLSFFTRISIRASEEESAGRPQLILLACFASVPVCVQKVALTVSLISCSGRFCVCNDQCTNYESVTSVLSI